MATFVDWALARAQEQTPYHGVISLPGSIGVAVSPKLQAALTIPGLALAGVVPVVRKERAKPVRTARLLTAAAGGCSVGGQAAPISGTIRLSVAAGPRRRAGPGPREEVSLARIPYADPEKPETKELVQRIVRERGGVLNLHAMLLHGAPVAEGWLRCLTAIRHECALPGSLREPIILQIAHLSGATYEAEQHAPIAKEGLTQEQVNARRTGGMAACSTRRSRRSLPAAMP